MKKNMVMNLILALPVFLLMSAFTGTTTLTDDSIAGGAYLTFAGKHSGEIAVAEIVSHKELSVTGCAAGSKIYQFTLNVRKDGKILSFSGKSPLLSAEVQAALKTLKKGDSFYFEKVKAHEPEGYSVDVRAGTFTVV
ncbi:MAG: hypothetical protein R3D00_04855 [Bacteroidia bacterium]